MDERMQFVARRLAGEPMVELCRVPGPFSAFEKGPECSNQGQACEIQSFIRLTGVRHQRSSRGLAIASGLLSARNLFPRSPLPKKLPD